MTLELLGNVSRWFFYGPGINNFDQTIRECSYHRREIIWISSRRVQCVQSCSILRSESHPQGLKPLTSRRFTIGVLVLSCVG